METILSGLRRVWADVFKSYYVVWKPPTRHAHIFIHGLFKSYYVVWKRAFLTAPAAIPTSLNRTMQYGNRSVYPPESFQPTPFKSYYVVWKLRRYATGGSHAESLNRTMQYGNACMEMVPPTILGCLNRTMQYGNYFSDIPYNTIFWV